MLAAQPRASAEDEGGNVHDAEVLMLDTNVFNHLLDGRIDPESLRGKRMVATHIQRDELLATGVKDPTRRDALMALFAEFVATRESTSSAVAGVSVAGEAHASASGMVPTESSVWGVSVWGAAKWSREDDLFSGMKRDLDRISRRKRNNVKDILIAETAIRNGWTLVTSDVRLAKIASKYGCNCVNLATRGRRG